MDNIFLAAASKRLFQCQTDVVALSIIERASPGGASEGGYYRYGVEVGTVMGYDMLTGTDFRSWFTTFSIDLKWDTLSFARYPQKVIRGMTMSFSFYSCEGTSMVL